MNKAMVKIGMFIGLLVISTVVSANAQATKRYRANIGFDFSVGEKSYKAGKYDVRVDNASILMIEDMDGKKLWVATTSPTEAELRRDATTLIFNRYEDRYFLAKVVSNEFGSSMKMSADEKRMAKREDLTMKTVSLKVK